MDLLGEWLLAVDTEEDGSLTNGGRGEVFGIRYIM